MTEGGGGVILGGDINNPNNARFTTSELTTTHTVRRQQQQFNQILRQSCDVQTVWTLRQAIKWTHAITQPVIHDASANLAQYLVSRNDSRRQRKLLNTGGAYTHQIHVVGAQNNVFNRFVLKFF